MNEILREFLLETHENLVQLDLDLVTLEKQPTERETLARVFRTLHTIKGTAGFLGLVKLQDVAHHAETLLSLLRDGALTFNRIIATTLLEAVDAVKRILGQLEASESEGGGNYSDIVQKLQRLSAEGNGQQPPSQRKARDSKVKPPDPGSQANLAEAPTPTPLPVSPLRQDTPPQPAPSAMADAPPPAPAAPSPPPSSVARAAPPSSAVRAAPASSVAPAAPAAGSSAARSVRAAVPASVVLAPKDGVPVPPPVPPLRPAELPAPELRAPAVAESAIRVDVGLLDKLMNLVGELVLSRNQIVQYSASQEDGPFLGTVQRLNQLTTELQTNVMKTRMQPINNVWNRYSRIVRDLAVACKKEVIFKMDGQDTELDKTIIEAIRDPLTHLVRNAIDHGIELPGEREKRGKSREGRLLLHAFQEGGKVIIEIADDGCGIDPRRVRDKAVLAGVITPEQATRLTESELLHLIFVPGFSTAEKVTQFSGRGVGMDVVRNRIENIGGTVSIDSRPGRGTTVKMKIPLTLAIIPALTITSAGERYCIPQVSLQELVRPNTDIEHIHGAPVYRLRGTLLPLVYLDRELRLRQGTNGAASNDINIVVLQADDRQFGLVVDGIHDTEEIVVKPLQKQLKGIGAFAGATIMGDGRVALILDVVGLAQRAHVIAGVRERAMNEKAEESLEDQVERPPLLLVGSHEGERLAIPLAQVARLEEFSRSIIEHMGTSEVVQYRGEILRLVHINRALNQPRRRRNSVKDGARKRAATPAAATPQSDTIQVVVYAGQGLRVGLVVDKILDIVAEPLLAKAPSNRPGVMFSAVVQGRVTEFLDIDSILRAADSHLFRGGNNGLLEGPA